MNKRIPQSESFLFVRTAATGRILTLKLEISHNDIYHKGPAVCMTDLDGCNRAAQGTPDEVEMWCKMLEEARQFAVQRIEEAKKLIIDEP